MKDVFIVADERARFIAREVYSERRQFQAAEDRQDVGEMRKALAYADDGMATARAWKRVAKAHASAEDAEVFDKLNRAVAEAQRHVTTMRKRLRSYELRHENVIRG